MHPVHGRKGRREICQRKVLGDRETGRISTKKLDDVKKRDQGIGQLNVETEKPLSKVIPDTWEILE